MANNNTAVPRAWPRLRSRPRQRGALLILFALMLVGLLGFTGLALDLAQLYNRKTELQNLADSAALAAAQALDGSSAGIAAAVQQAKTAAEARKYAYSQAVQWDDAALSFSAAPDSADTGWIDAASAADPANAENLLYAKVDTARLGAAHGTVDLLFMGALSPPDAANPRMVNGRAVAGRSAIRVTPLGICALEPGAPAASRPSAAGAELVEYGFRRGVGYNLRNLSAAGATPLTFLIDPVAPGDGVNFSAAAVAPFVCAGRMPVNSLPATVRVQFPFPAALSDHLNARFNTYSGTPRCNAIAAPPDTNIRPYLPTGPVWWTPAASLGQTAMSVTSPAGHLVTVADLPAASAPANAGDYGVLWSYATAVQYAAVQPAAGYVPFAKANWPQLYPVAGANPAPAVASNYPAAPHTPYRVNYAGGVFYTAPSSPAQRERRVLNLPLLTCLDAGGGNATATVLAIGRFFMTAPATASAISAEFAGVVKQQALGDLVRLYQ